MESGFTIFDFGKVDVGVFYGDEIDFVEIGFMVSCYNSVTLLLQISSDGLFGLLTDFSGIFMMF